MTDCPAHDDCPGCLCHANPPCTHCVEHLDENGELVADEAQADRDRQLAQAAKALEAFNEAVTAPWRHAQDELRRQRLRQLFGTNQKGERA